jgi:hypothetical protein
MTLATNDASSKASFGISLTSFAEGVAKLLSQGGRQLPR